MDDLFKKPILDENGLLCDVAQLRQLLHDLALTLGGVILGRQERTPLEKIDLLHTVVILHTLTCTEKEGEEDTHKGGNTWSTLTQALEAARVPAKPHLS